MTNWKTVHIIPTKWDLYVKIVTFGFVDLWAIRFAEYVKGYRQGRKDEADSWWREQENAYVARGKK